MIAHVAEATENSGRVVLQIAAHGELAPIALAAALRVAHSFNASLESLVTEDPGIIDFARFDFAREVTAQGVLLEGVTVSGLEELLQNRAVRLHGEVALAARTAGVPVHCRTLREMPVDAIAAACFENGPWNVAVLAQAVSAQTEAHVRELFDAIQDVTGIVVAGRDASRTVGTVVAIVEQLAHVQPMLRAAEYLAGIAGGDVHLILFAGNTDETAWMEGQVRLVLGGDTAPGLLLAPEIFASPSALVRILQDLNAGFVIARMGGTFLPADGGLADFAQSHAGPVFLVR